MIRIPILLAIVIAFLLSPSLPAQSDGQEREAAHKTFEEADQALNQIYKTLLNRFEDKSRAPFVKAQRAWLAWRDAEAEFAGAPMMGSNYYNMIVHETKRDLTLDRVVMLFKLEANTRAAAEAKAARQAE